MASIGTKKGTEKAQGGITSNSIKNEAVIACKIHPDVRAGAYILYNGKGQPLLTLAAMSGFAAGTDNVECLAVLPNGGHILYNPIGAISAAPYGPKAAAAGLDLAPDHTDTEGCGYVVGGTNGPFVLTTKRDITDPIPAGMFLRWKGIISDVSGAAEFAIGFRKVEAYQALIDDYADMACLNVQAGTVNAETIVGGAATVTVDSGLDWLDGETHEVLVICHGNGKVEFFFDGLRAPSGAAYQFTEDLAVYPFIHVLEGTTLPSAFNTVELEVGHLKQIAKKE